MKKILILTALLLAFILPIPKNIHAQGAADCSTVQLSTNTINVGEPLTVTKSDGLRPDEGVIARITGTNVQGSLNCIDTPSLCTEPFPVNLFTLDTFGLSSNETYEVEVRYIRGDGASCTDTRPLTVVPGGSAYCEDVGLTGLSPTDGNEATLFSFSGCVGGGFGGSPCNGRSRIGITGTTALGEVGFDIAINDEGIDNCGSNGQFTTNFAGFTWGIYEARLYIGNDPVGISIPFEVGQVIGDNVGDPCSLENECNNDLFSGTQTCYGEIALNSEGQYYCSFESGDCTSCQICGDGICTTSEIQTCPDDCILVGEIIDPTCNGGQGIDTAIGCIPFFSIQNTTRFFLAWSMGIAGGFGVLLIAYSGILVLMSQGNPDRLKEARSLLLSAIGGLLLVALSVFLLRTIGVDILELFS